MEYLSHPIALWTGLAGGLLGCLALFLSLKREAAHRELRHRKALDALDAQWRIRFEALERGYSELAEVTQVFVPPPPPRSGINPSKRSQVLQMHRTGEAAEQIATALAVPRNEVDLLLKVHSLVISGLEAG